MIEFDKNQINKLLQGSDAQLWQSIRAIAGASGVELPEGMSENDMQRIRKQLANAGPKDIERAMKFLENYNKK